MNYKYGLYTLVKEEVTFFCKNNIYIGTLIDFHDDHVLITNPKIVFESGVKEINTDELFIQRSNIECYGVLDLNDHDNNILDLNDHLKRQ